MKIRLFHVTSKEAASAIVAGGFVTPAGHYGYLGDLRGCFVSAAPLSVMEGAKGDTALEVIIDSTPEQMFYEWEIIEDFKPYREWCIPAEILNRGTIRQLPEDEVDAINAADCWNEYPPGEPDKTLSELNELDPHDPL